MSAIQATSLTWLAVLVLTFLGLSWANRALDRRRANERAQFHQQQAEIEAAMREHILAQLDKSKKPSPPAWARVLGLSLPVDKTQVQQAFRELSKKHHPDKGGSVALMQQLVEARTQALNWVRTTAPA